MTEPTGPLQTDTPAEAPDPAGPAEPERVRPWARAWQAYRDLPVKRQRLVAMVVVVVGLLLTGALIEVYARAQVQKAEVVVERVRITGGDPDSERLTLKLTCRIQNPSYFNARVAASRFQVYYMGELAGVILVPAVGLPRGRNTVELTTTLENRNSPAFAVLAYQLLAGREISVTIQGDIEVDSLLDLTLPVDKQVLVEGIGW